MTSIDIGEFRALLDEERKRISKKTRELRESLIKNTALKFKINTLFAKLLSFEEWAERQGQKPDTYVKPKGPVENPYGETGK